VPIPRRSRRPSPRRLVLSGVVLGVVAATFAVSTDAFGAGHLFQRAVARLDRFVAGPVPDRPTDGTILVTPAPTTPAATASTAVPSTARPPGASATATAAPSPTPTPSPIRAPVDIDMAADPEAVFAHELEDTWCAPAGVQITLAFLGLADTSHAFQRELQGRVREWESAGDSRNGNWGPSAMALALEAYGAPGYEVRGYQRRADALRDAAVAIETTHAPVILLAWRGAHTWVMTGFRADADPRLFPDATVEGAYILDPWYPWVSSIWGPSDPPGTFQDAAEMERNYLRWKRPEGHYPERDGLFIAVVPTVVVSPPN
jgi:hypothetical protein